MRWRLAYWPHQRERRRDCFNARGDRYRHIIGPFWWMVATKEDREAHIARKTAIVSRVLSQHNKRLDQLFDQARDDIERRDSRR